MLQILCCLTAIIATVYSDCCTDPAKARCDDETDIRCSLKYYGIHCCNEKVKDSIALFANDSNKIVS